MRRGIEQRRRAGAGASRLAAGWVGWGLAVLALALGTTAGAQPLAEVRWRPLSGLRADVANLILAGRAGGAFRMAALAAPRARADGTGSVELWVEIDGAGLLGEPPAEARLTVELYAYALADGAVAGFLARSVRLDLEQLGAALYDGGLKLGGELALEPGSYELRVLAREPRSQRFALRVLPLVVPEPTPAAPLLLPPRFADPAAGWIVARDGRDDGDEAPPAIIPVLASGRTQQAELRIFGPLPQPPQLVARFFDLGGRPVAEVAFAGEPLNGAAAPAPQR
ncbi:MAG: hypothetical protein D6696_00195, partial [Acidobacteria bacterium]